jgi:hypothetical protein
MNMMESIVADAPGSNTLVRRALREPALVSTSHFNLAGLGNVDPPVLSRWERGRVWRGWALGVLGVSLIFSAMYPDFKGGSESKVSFSAIERQQTGTSFRSVLSARMNQAHLAEGHRTHPYSNLVWPAQQSHLIQSNRIQVPHVAAASKSASTINRLAVKRLAVKRLAVKRLAVKRLAGIYTPIVERAAARYHVSPLLAAAVLHVETRAAPYIVVSGAGAIGPMQLMPETAWHQLHINPWNIHSNIYGGVKYLGELLDRFHSTKMALMAYNAGPTIVGAGRPPENALQYADDVVKNMKR